LPVYQTLAVSLEELRCITAKQHFHHQANRPSSAAHYTGSACKHSIRSSSTSDLLRHPGQRTCSCCPADARFHSTFLGSRWRADRQPSRNHRRNASTGKPRQVEQVPNGKHVRSASAVIRRAVAADGLRTLTAVLEACCVLWRFQSGRDSLLVVYQLQGSGFSHRLQNRRSVGTPGR
jgi:hypothetical protein